MKLYKLSALCQICANNLHIAAKLVDFQIHSFNEFLFLPLAAIL